MLNWDDPLKSVQTKNINNSEKQIKDSLNATANMAEHQIFAENHLNHLIQK